MYLADVYLYQGTSHVVNYTGNSMIHMTTKSIIVLIAFKTDNLRTDDSVSSRFLGHV